jgi:hypothetical protein
VGDGRITPTFLTSELDDISGQLHAPPACSRGKSPDVYCTVTRVGPRAVLNVMQKEKSLALTANQIPSSLLSSPQTSLFSDRILPAPSLYGKVFTLL